MRALVAALVLNSSPLIAAEGTHSDDDHLSERDGVRIVHAWTQATNDDHAMVFMEIENKSDQDVQLIGASN